MADLPVVDASLERPGENIRLEFLDPPPEFADLRVLGVVSGGLLFSGLELIDVLELCCEVFALPAIACSVVGEAFEPIGRLADKVPPGRPEFGCGNFLPACHPSQVSGQSEGAVDLLQGVEEAETDADDRLERTGQQVTLGQEVGEPVSGGDVGRAEMRQREGVGVGTEADLQDQHRRLAGQGEDAGVADRSAGQVPAGQEAEAVVPDVQLASVQGKTRADKPPVASAHGEEGQLAAAVSNSRRPTPAFRTARLYRSASVA